VACDAIGWWAKRCLIFALLALSITQARRQPVAESQPYIQTYLYRPPGNGPFLLVIYNHGSRENRERESWPFSYVGRVLLQSGYAVLVPERRGSKCRSSAVRTGLAAGGRWIRTFRSAL
jgi:dienelactone hydrolase